jgi:cytochrome c-type biogenesis protein CcmH
MIPFPVIPHKRSALRGLATQQPEIPEIAAGPDPVVRRGDNSAVWQGIRLQLLLIFLLLPVAAFAVQPDEMLADAQLEAHARAISADLRCLVCQNQSIDDSDADLAHDLRLLVRQRLSAGDNDAQVRQYIVDRYGDYVLLNPPLKPSTYALWLGPLALLVVAASAAFLFYRRRKEVFFPLSEQEKQRLAALIRNNTSS